MAATPLPVPAPAPASIAPTEIEHGTSLWRDAWHRLRKNKLAVFGMVSLAIITLACVVGPLASPYTYSDMNFEDAGLPPSWKHWFGTDDSGRDLMVRTLIGGRLSLAVGLCATLVALTIGVTYGAVAGYVGGKLDALMMRIVDIIYALPFTIFVILLMVFTRTLTLKFNLGSGFDLMLIFAAIGAVEWLTMARIVRGQVMSIKKMEYVEAARSLGYSPARIIFRHILPNTLGPVIVYTTLTIPAVMLLEAFLSYLGLGVQAPMSSWGVLLNDGQQKLEEYPWLLLFPAGMFSWTLFSLNFLGDGLRDALDVRSSKD